MTSRTCRQVGEALYTVNRAQGRSTGSIRPAQRGAVTGYRCGGNHTAAHCQFRDKCRACGKVGHMAKLYHCKQAPSSLPQTGESVHKVEDPAPPDEYTLYPVVVHHQGVLTPLMSTVTIEGKSLCMEVDTGASVSLIGMKTFKELWPGDSARVAAIQCQTETYTGEEIGVMGSITVTAQAIMKKPDSLYW